MCNRILGTTAGWLWGLCSSFPRPIVLRAFAFCVIILFLPRLGYRTLSSWLPQAPWPAALISPLYPIPSHVPVVSHLLVLSLTPHFKPDQNWLCAMSHHLPPSWSPPASEFPIPHVDSATCGEPLCFTFFLLTAPSGWAAVAFRCPLARSACEPQNSPSASC